VSGDDDAVPFIEMAATHVVVSERQSPPPPPPHMSAQTHSSSQHNDGATQQALLEPQLQLKDHQPHQQQQQQLLHSHSPQQPQEAEMEIGSRGNNAVHWAAWKNHTILLQQLLNNKHPTPNPSHPNREGTVTGFNGILYAREQEDCTPAGLKQACM
jgi:hypothetical protein